MDVVSYSRSGAARPPQIHTPERDRVAWVDTAKGICIIFVVMMHSTLGVGFEMGGEGFMHSVVAFARPFRMPDFFLVSGLFLGRVIGRDWRSYADKRVVHFLYFYLLWLVIQSVLKYGQLSGGSPLGFAAHLAHSLIEPYSTLWFIYILAIFSIVTKLLVRVPKTIVLAAAVALQVLPIESPWFLLNEFCGRWVYFLAGYMFAPQIFAIASRVGDHVGRTAIGLVAWALVNGALAMTPAPSHGTLAELPGIGLMLGVAGALAIVAVAALTARFGTGKLPIAAFLRYCGQNSIVIYLAFFLPMALTRTFLIRSGLVTNIGLVSLITLVVAVIVPLGFERLVRNTPLFFLFRRPRALHLPPPRPAQTLQAAE